MVGFAFFATLIIYFDRQALAIVSASPDFKKAVPLSESQYGNITAAFMLAYTIMNGLSGPFIDAVGTRIGYACCLLWWAVAGILHVFTRSALYLGGCRFMIGASEAGNWPAAAKMISEWFPSKERALASGIFNSGASVAALVSFPLIAWIVVHWGWKSAFVTMSLFGFLWIIAWWFFAPKQSGVGVIVPKRVPARELLSTRFVIVFTISKAFMDPAWYFFVFWFPKYLSSTFHFTLREIGWKGSAPYVTAFLGNIAGGALTALFIRLGVANSTARKISTTLFALAMTSIIPASFTTNAPPRPRRQQGIPRLA